MHVSEGVSHSQRRVRSGLAVDHPQPPWRTRHPCSVDVLPGPTGVTSSPGRDESERLTVCRCQSLSSHWLAASLVQRFCKRCGKGPIGKAPGLAPDPWDVVRLRTSPRRWNDPGKGHTASFSSSSSGRSRWLSRRQCRSSPLVSAETLKACALIGLHLLATEDEAGSKRQSASGFRRHVSHGRKAKALLLLSSANATWKALLRMLRSKTSQVEGPLFLEDWELVKVALSCHIALDMLCQEMHEAL